MGDIGDDFRQLKEQTKQHRRQMLEKADIRGWTQHTEYHFSRVIDGVRVDWWPSGGKAKIGNKMVYGHRKVNAKLKRMLNKEVLP